MNWISPIVSVAAAVVWAAFAISTRRDYRRVAKARDESAALLAEAIRVTNRLYDAIGIQEKIGP